MNFAFQTSKTRTNKKILIIDDNNHYPVYMYVSEGKYIEHFNDTFKNMYYIEEEKRGFFPEEDLIVPGRYELELLPNEEKEVCFICSLENNIEQLDTRKVIENEIIRINKLIIDSELINIKKETESSKDKEYRRLIEKYIIAADNFVVNRPNFRLHTIIAGYPWFLDWGRDSMIAFEGLLLIPKRFEIAKEVLAGKWGNGAERKRRLTQAGYDFTVIQSIVNELVRT